MDRSLLVNEFHQLQVFLNRSNKLPNQESKFGFEVLDAGNSEYRLYAFVQSKSEKHKIALTIRDRFCHWDRSGFTHLKNLEIFCADSLNYYEELNEIQKIISTSDLILLSESISNTFKNLAFNP
jgi:hypothetical protein